MEYTIDLEKDYENICRGELTRIGYGIAVTDDAEDIEIKCINYYFRLPIWKPRKVLEAKDFSCPTNLQSYYSNLKQKIEAGDDLTEYLSKLIKRDYQDKMLEDWKVYHLHLFSQLPGTPHNPLDGNIVYCSITEDIVYVLFIGNHSQFSDQSMLSIISDNWPDLMKNSTVCDDGELMMRASNSDISELRKNNINTLMEVNGKIITPIGGGFDSCGNSLMVTMRNDMNRKWLRDFEKNINSTESKIQNIILSNGQSIPQKLNISLIFEDETFFIYEKNTNLRLCKTPLKLRP